MGAAATRGAVVGGLAAVPVALVDLAMSWSWLTRPTDAAEMLARLMGLLIPIGALLGAAIACLGAFTTPRVARAFGARERALWPAPFLVLASPAIVMVAWLLFSGGMAASLPHRPLWVLGAAAALFASAYAALRIGRVLLIRPRTRVRAAVHVTASVALFAGASGIDHLVLPGLYGYLHASLAFVSWTAAALAVHAVLGDIAAPAPHAVELRRGAVGLAVLLGVFALDVATLGANQTVHLALRSPRASVARSVMMAVGPLRMAEPVARAASVERARRARARRANARPVEPVAAEIDTTAHLLLVTIDALRPDHLGAYGYAVRPTTPRLDRFAEGAVVFETAYAQAPHSSYSLGSLMTSSYLMQRAERGLPLPIETLASCLTEAGYHTAAFYTDGIFHTDGERLGQYRDSGFGFSRRSHVELGAELKTDEVLSEVDAVASTGERPTFFWAHYFDAHEPYRDTHFGSSDIERYDSEIRRVDRALARLISEVDARLSRPVVVAITADHGEEFRDHGGVYHGSTVYQEQIRVPLIVRVPSGEARHVATPVELVDLAPTLLSLLDVEPAPTMEGDDLRPLLEGRTQDVGPAFATAGSRHMAVAWPDKLILNMRYGTLELYDLEADPRERENLADTRADTVDALTGEVRAWLDALSLPVALDGETEEADPHRVALHRGRASDLRAVPGLIALLADRSASARQREEAARLLGGLSEDAREPLAAALSDSAPGVAAEAAIALGRLRDERALPRLRSTRFDTADRRVRAAIARGWLGDETAASSLIEALDDDVPRRDREDAVHLLGSLGDPRAVEPLVELLEEGRLRRRAVISLGRVGDARAIPPIRALLESSSQSSTRDAVARALGQLGDADAIPILLRLMAEGHPSASESMVRLAAIGQTRGDAAVGGVDVGPALARRVGGLTRCRALPADHEWVYLGRTRCRTRGASVTLPVEVPVALRAGAMVRVRMRRVDAGQPTWVRILGDGVGLATVSVDSEWSEASVPASAITRRITLEAASREVRLDLDHVLIVPAVAAVGEGARAPSAGRPGRRDGSST